MPRRSTVLEQIVDKHDAMRNEAIASDGNEFAYEGVRLHACSSSDDGAPLNFDKWSNEHVVRYRAFVKIDRLDHRHSFAERDISNP